MAERVSRLAWSAGILVCLAAGLVAVPSGAQEPGQVLQAAEIRENIFCSAILSDSVYLLAGDRGKIFRSEDAGKTWREIPSGVRVPLFSVRFVDGQNGWICGKSGLILSSSDGGLTWKKQNSPTKKHLLGIDFVDTKKGCVVGDWGQALVTEDGGTTWQVVERSHYQGQRWRLNPLSFTGLFRGQFPVAWFVTMLVVALLGGFGMGTSIDWYTEAQRIQSARTVRDASYSIWAGTLAGLIRNAMWAVAVLGFFVLFPHIAAQKDYEMGWYVIGFKYLPVGMVGFFFAGILAIHLSTISTHLNLGAMYATRDFYHHYVNPQASERRLVWVGRIATLVVLGGSFVFGLIIGEEITAWLIFALWIMAAGVWLPNILQVIWWRFNAWGYLSAWAANLGLSWLVVWVLPRFGVIPELPDYLQFWSLIFLNALVYVPVTLLTKPEDMDHLVRYYVMSRPIGFWGPVRREALRRGLLG